MAKGINRWVCLAASIATVWLAGAGFVSAALQRPDAAAGLEVLAPYREDRKLLWLDDLEAGFTLATVEYRPVLVLFSAPDCSWCLRLKRQVLEDPALSGLLGAFVLVEIDTTVDRDAAAQYGIRGVPALLVLTNDGRVRTGHAGYLDAAGLRKMLEPVLNPELVRSASKPDQDVIKMLEGGNIRSEDWPVVLTAFGGDSLRDEVRARALALDPFPALEVVEHLKDARLRVRAGALDLLEELAGTTYGYDVWNTETFSSSKQQQAFNRWTAWAGGVTGRVQTVYASLDSGSIARLVQDLVSDDRERSRRAMRLLGQGGDAVASALAELLEQTPDLPMDARQRIRVVQYSLYLPSNGPLPAEETAHRLVFGNPDARMKAIGALSALGTEALPILREFLSDPDPMIRETAADSMIAAGKRRALPDLGRLLMNEQNRHVQHAVLRGLGSIKSQASLVLLIPFLSHQDENLAVAAYESVARMESQDPVDAIASGFRDARWRVRVAALETASKLRMKKLAPAVQTMLQEDADEYVRFAAVNTLAVLGAKNSADMLEDIFMQDDALKGPVIAAFGAMELPLPPTFLRALPNLEDETLFAVVQGLKEAGVSGLPMAAALCEHPNSDIACAALAIVGARVGQYGQYMPLLVNALESGSRAKRIAILEALGSRSRYYSDDEAIDVGFADETGTTNAKPDLVSAGEVDVSDEPSAADAVFAAFADPSSVATPEEPSVEASPVDDVFAAFADPEAPPPVSGDSSLADEAAVDDVFSAFEAAAPEPPVPDVASGNDEAESGTIIGTLFRAFRGGSAASGVVGTRPADWRAFTEAVVACLKAEDADVRLAAALWLASISDERSIPELTVLTEDRTSAQRADIARALGRIRHREGFATLLRFLDDPASSVREAAIGVLYNSSIGIERMFQALLRPEAKLTIDELVINRKRNLKNHPALRSSLHAQATNLLEHAEVRLQNAGLIVLSECGSRGDVSDLLPFLEAEDPFVRRAAWYALGTLDSTRFEKEIDRLVADTSEWVRGVLPAIYTKSYGAWVHFLDQKTPLRAGGYDSYYYSMDSYGSRRPSMPAAVLDALRKLGQDPVPAVRFESLFCLMVNRQYVDLQAVVDAAHAFPDRKAVAGRIASFMMSNYQELGKPFAVLLPYLEASDYADSSLERLRTRFGQDDEGASVAQLKILRMPGSGTAPTNEPLFVDAPVEVSVEKVLHVVYFTTPGCRECERVRAMLDQLSSAIPELTVETHEIQNPDALRLNQVLSSRFRVPASEQGVTPALFAGGGYIIRSGFNTDRIGSLIASSASVPLAEWREMTDEDTAEAIAAIENRFAEISIWLLLAYAISDSVNPCAFAAIIFFISYLQVTKRSPRQIAEVSLAFIAAVFVTYLVLGFGLGEIIARVGALRRAGAIMNGVMAVLTLVLALLSLRDAWLCGHGRMQAMTLQLPGVLKNQMHRVIRTQARQPRFVLAAAVTGVAISILELACTGQAYLPAIHYMLRTQNRVADAAGYLILYNLAFVAPLFVIFGLTVGGMRSESFIRWLQHHAMTVKLVSAALFLMLFVILIRQW